MNDPLIGKTLGNYQLERLLGEGGMGSVYLARHPTIGRQVAIKVLAPHIGAQPELAERFINEAKASARIAHPNVIDIFDFGKTEEGLLYCVMEHLDGSELADVMRARGPMQPHEVLALLEPIAAALEAAHAKGVVHRDLKPENIFVVAGEPPLVKVLDFGIAKLLEVDEGAPNLTATGMVMGTPYTIAPEQAAGQPSRIGPRTDLYSLGVVLYWMLAGRPPFHQLPTVMILAKHMTEPPPPLRQFAPHLPEELAAVVARCLEKEPEKRPASAGEVLEAFRQALGSIPVPKTQIAMASPSAASADAALAPTLAPTAVVAPNAVEDAGAQPAVARQLTTLPPAKPASKTGVARSKILLLAVVVGLLLIGGTGAALFFAKGEAETPAPPPGETEAVVPPPKVAKAAQPAAKPAAKGVAPAPKPATRARPAAKAPVATPPPAPAVERPRLSTAPIDSAPRVVYVARIGRHDHFNRHGKRLSSAAAIVRQDRANYHRYGRRDAEDRGDRLFGSKAMRGELAGKIHFKGGAARAIRYTNPLIRVEVIGDRSTGRFFLIRSVSVSLLSR